MKILIQQLARLGDIYLTIPTIRAIKRKWPEAEVHILVRDRFKAATEALTCADAIWIFDSAFFLEPLTKMPIDIESSKDRVKDLRDALRAQSFEWIINLSFSPVSSFITHMIATKDIKVSGYTRYSDGFLSIPDDASAYFYAQVGIGRANRVHVADLFAQLADVDLEPSDWRIDAKMDGSRNLPLQYIVVHLGASQKTKSYPIEYWKRVLEQIQLAHKKTIILIGSAEEVSLASLATSGSENNKIINLVGKTRLHELFNIIRNAKLLIGADSAPIHMASLVGTRCLNLSFSTVNFWETGPRSPGSRVLIAKTPEELVPEYLVRESVRLLEGADSLGFAAEVVQGIPSYRLTGFDKNNDFEWRFLQGLYMGKELPEIEDEETLLAVIKMREINIIAIEQIEHLLIKRNESDRQNFSAILSRADDVMYTIGRMVSHVRPLIKWMEVQKIRIGPGEIEEITQKTLQVYKDVEFIFSLYLGPIREKKGEIDESTTMVQR